MSLVTLGAGDARLLIGADRAKWWAEVMGDNDTQLALLGTGGRARSGRTAGAGATAGGGRSLR